MSANTRDMVLFTCTILGFVAAVVAGMWRLWLKPFLRRELFDPVQEARKQVAENHHSNEKPTVLDRVDDVYQSVAASRSEIRDLNGKVDNLDAKVDGHLIAAAGIDAGIAARVTELERRIGRLEK